MADPDADIARGLVRDGLSYSAAARRLEEMCVGGDRRWFPAQVSRICREASIPTTHPVNTHPHAVRVVPRQPPTPVPPADPENPAEPEPPPATLLEDYTRRLRVLDAFAEEQRRGGSATAAVAAMKAAIDLRERIEALRPKAVDPITAATDDELREIIEAPSALREVG